MNTVRKTDSENGKPGQKYQDKGADLDNVENVVKEPSKDLDMNVVDIVLIDEEPIIGVTVENTMPDIHKVTDKKEKDKEEITTDMPQYTIVSLKKDEKVNVLYTIDTSGPGNDTEPVDSNDIEGGLEIWPPREIPKIQPTPTEVNSTAKAIVPTLRPDTEGVVFTVKPEETQQGVDHEKRKTTGPAPETQTREEAGADSKPEAVSQEMGQDTGAENLSIIGK